MTPSFDQLNENRDPADGEGYPLTGEGANELNQLVRDGGILTLDPFLAGEALRWYESNQDLLPKPDSDLVLLARIFDRYTFEVYALPKDGDYFKNEILPPLSSSSSVERE